MSSQGCCCVTLFNSCASMRHCVCVNEPSLVLDALLANSFAAGLTHVLLYTDEATSIYGL